MLGAIDEKKINDILIKLELIKLKNRHPMCLSGGQMQRLAVAVGMLVDREIIILVIEIGRASCRERV